MMAFWSAAKSGNVPLALGHECYPVNTAPEAYDIIWANFPYDEEPYEPGPQRHPCLVLNKKVFKDSRTGHDYASLQVMYGTSQNQRERVPPWEYLHIHNYDATNRCGLYRETFFMVGRIQRILWCEEYMPNLQNGSPILGRLPHDYILSLKKLKEIREAVAAQN